EAAAKVVRQFQDRAGIRTLPEIARLHQVLRDVGVKPRRHPPSNQKLLEFALKHGTLPAINNLVDAYNLLSLRTLASLGAHDAGQISSPVELRILSGEETFTPLGSSQPETVVADEFGYVDGQGRLLCRLDSLQADFSKVSDSTRDVLVIVEFTTATPDQARRAAVELTMEVISQHCGGTAEIVSMPG
ncbi:MAG: phenylalanine--tRNA ligase beta subunit-related protein, partial [Pirellulaceae bacterium]|nr:phenylalanine--tRNA ligase beta subunit-related protein [Pirellulaceae bacterium]